MFPMVCDVVFGPSIFSDRHPCIAVLSIFVMVPLALMRDISSLAKWSLLAIFGIVYLGIALIIGGATVDHPPDR
jgi:amino acid permease